MLQLILGRSGSGKSTYVLKEAALLPVDKVMVVVPEQFTLETERRLLDAFGCNALPKSTVTSFSAMAQQYHTEYEPSGRYINDFGRHITMARTLREERDALRLYNGKISRSLIESFLALTSEMKSSCLLPEELLRAAEEQSGNILGDKLYDIGLVAAHYDSLVKENYVDSEDDLTKLAEGISRRGLYRGMTVFIDGFHNFSVQEERVIEALLTQAEKVFVTMPCGDLIGKESDAYLFENVREDARKLIAAAERLGIPHEKAVLLKENRRGSKPALKEWEQSVVGVTKPTEDCNGIELYSALNASEEASLLAALIAEDVKEGKYRYRDCAVIVRSLKNYEVLLKNALNRAGIPFYMDSRADIRLQPLFTLMQTAVDAAAGRRFEESVFRCLKTGFFPADPDAVYRLENYCLMWNLHGRELFEEYKGNPRGFDENETDFDKATLEDRNKTRKAVMKPIEKLCDRLTGRFTGEEFGRALYDFLLELDVPKQIDRLSEDYRGKNREIEADEIIRLWEQAVSVLDQLVYAAGDVSMTASEARDLFDVACLSADMGKIPPTADAVTVGSADRVRLADVKSVYIFACNEGEFPQTPSGSGILTDFDRKKLKEKDLHFGGDSAYWSVEEMFIAYKAFTAASEKLTVLYHRAGKLGEKAEPSSLISNLTEKFPSLKEQKAEDLPIARLTPTRAAALALLASRWKRGDSETLSLKEALLKDEETSPTVRCMEEASKTRNVEIRDPEYAAALFGRDMRVSASKVEKFNACPYRYFLQYGLRLSPMQKFGLRANTLGTIAHDMMEKALRELCDKGLDTVTPDEVNDCADRWAEKYYNDRIKVGKPVQASDRYQFERTKRNVSVVLNNVVEELKQSAFEPIAYELEVGQGKTVPAYELPCRDGSISVEGKIDRVDYMDGKRKYIRVIDYKSGSKDFDLSHLLKGKDMQMLLYLFALRKNGGETYRDASPGGAMYCPVKRDDIKEQNKPETENTERAKKKQMNGLFLNNVESVLGMEKDLQKRYIPIEYDKAGVLTGKTLVTEEEINVLSDYIDMKLIEMHDRLNAGEINPTPGEEACNYCSYKAICSTYKTEPQEADEKPKTGDPMEEIRSAVEKKKQEEGSENDAG